MINLCFDGAFNKMMRKHANTQRGRCEDGYTDKSQGRRGRYKKNKMLSCFYVNIFCKFLSRNMYKIKLLNVLIKCLVFVCYTCFITDLFRHSFSL